MEIEISKNDKLKEFLVCNDYMAMLLLNEKRQNYLYYLSPKYFVKSLDEEKSIKSLICEPFEINYAIKNNMIIYSSDKLFTNYRILKMNFIQKWKILIFLIIYQGKIHIISNQY